jgi:ankyrin repeat protein
MSNPVKKILKSSTSQKSSTGTRCAYTPYSDASPLHAAVKKSDFDDVKRLIADGTSVNIEDYYGASPLHIAANNGHAEIAALLVNAGADIEAGARVYPDNRVFNATPLIVAAQQGHTKVAEVLINAGANVYAETHDSGGWNSAIHWAAWDGHTEIVRLLIERGADIEATRLYLHQLLDSKHPLHFVVRFGSLMAARRNYLGVRCVPMD